MRVPLSWLREFVDIELTSEELAERLTLLGMEVKHVERWGADWEQVVIGELLTVERHPRADRLSLTTVTLGDGGEPLSIVCGATNIAPGQRIPVALPGAVLPGNRRIERAEKMGVVSNGMLCSGEELRLTADADGILILPADSPLGVPLADLFGDVVLDVDVKPNRGDALSILGLAREVAAATRRPVRQPEIAVEEGSGPPTEARLAVDVRDPDLCTRFVGRWVSGVTVGPSPDHVQMRLLAAGQRPVSNVVDASNYVMLELGKPIHTFDAAAVHAGADGRATVVVRRATDGERLETLDHVERVLAPDMLLIADPVGVLGLAGVMGGATSEVSQATTDVVIESAVFDPVSIRRTAQRLSLRSEASSRFEKGQEARLARLGADRTAQLVRAWAGGEIAPGRLDTAPSEPGRSRVAFRPARINRLLGTSLGSDEQRELLSRVGIETEAAADVPVVVALQPEVLSVAPEADGAITALVPTWRRDIAIEADVAEEIARVRGYELVPSVTPDTEMPDYRPSPLGVRELVRDTLAGAGLTEVVTTALVSPRHVETFVLRREVPSVGGEPEPGGDPVGVTNPLSRDHSLLRRHLVGSLLDVVGTNLRHGTEDVAVFEIGKGYGRTGDVPREWWRLGFALVGAAEPRAWNRPARRYDLDDAKGILDLLAHRLGLGRPVYEAETAEPLFHPGRTARATITGRLGAIVGELHPDVVETWDLRTSQRVLVAELSLEGLAAGRLAPEHAPVVGRFPAVERDLAIVVPERTPAASVEALLVAHGGALLRDVRLFDIYRGVPLATDEKNLAYRLRFGAPDRTLTEPEIDAAVAAVLGALPAVGGRLRT
ncbi:MAG: phenylalanine--tRNA ligase subunit beta [Chloroflexi bacterium RBG_16_72_14]|nr:MAG: phenylalanine--tRNA ligase subunit beta [Chloroflexi bacterium RBG_16_72_14]